MDTGDSNWNKFDLWTQDGTPSLNIKDVEAYFNSQMQVDPKIKCGYCRKHYASKKSLLIHYRIHTGYKPYACHLCPKRFSQTNVLKAHINFHIGRRDWICTSCGKAFTQSAHLRTHQKIHSPLKDFQCPHCQKRFGSKGVRDRHLRQHTGEKPYKCAVCSKRFTRGESLRFHVNAHQGIRPYQCGFSGCLKNFTKQSTLTRHLKTNHFTTANATPATRQAGRPRTIKHEDPVPRLPSPLPAHAPIFQHTAPAVAHRMNNGSGHPNGNSNLTAYYPYVNPEQPVATGDHEDPNLKSLIENLSPMEFERLGSYLAVVAEDLMKTSSTPPYKSQHGGSIQHSVTNGVQQGYNVTGQTMPVANVPNQRTMEPTAPVMGQFGFMGALGNLIQQHDNESNAPQFHNEKLQITNHFKAIFNARGAKGY